jgi:hypothetical protein
MLGGRTGRQLGAIPFENWEARMSVFFNVEPLKQKHRMTCMPTVIWMMHRWYLDKIGLKNSQPIFDAIVNVSPVQIRAQEQQL